jgi:hypothetical protein
MRRAVLTLGGTAAGLAALLTNKTHAGAITAADGMPATARTSSAAAPATDGPAATPTAAASRPAGKSPAASATRTVTGAVVNTQYGPMQVQLTMAGQKITKDIGRRPRSFPSDREMPPSFGRISRRNET